MEGKKLDINETAHNLEIGEQAIKELSKTIENGKKAIDKGLLHIPVEDKTALDAVAEIKLLTKKLSEGKITESEVNEFIGKYANQVNR